MRINTTGQIIVSMIVGAAFMLFIQLLWLIDNDCFVKRSEAKQSRETSAMYDSFAANPIDYEE